MMQCLSILITFERYRQYRFLGRSALRYSDRVTKRVSGDSRNTRVDCNVRMDTHGFADVSTVRARVYAKDASLGKSDG